jgi:hypothetical protein
MAAAAPPKLRNAPLLHAYLQQACASNSGLYQYTSVETLGYQSQTGVDMSIEPTTKSLQIVHVVPHAFTKTATAWSGLPSSSRAI